MPAIDKPLDQDGTYRAVYTVKFVEAVFVLHCFNKKSRRGIETPKEDMDHHSRAIKGGRGRCKGGEK